MKQQHFQPLQTVQTPMTTWTNFKEESKITARRMDLFLWFHIDFGLRVTHSKHFQQNKKLNKCSIVLVDYIFVSFMGSAKKHGLRGLGYGFV